MYEAMPPSRRLKNKINVDEETLIVAKKILRDFTEAMVSNI
jgi:hypothetical protein